MARSIVCLYLLLVLILMPTIFINVRKYFKLIYKYLCVTVHHKLSWNEQICSIVKKANSSIGFLRRNLQIHQKHIKANAYKTLVRPQIEYASTIWDPFRWYREERPALLVTTTEAKQVSLPCLMSLAGAVSSGKEQTKD